MQAVIVRKTEIGCVVVRTADSMEVMSVARDVNEFVIHLPVAKYWAETDCLRPNHCRIFTPDNGVINCSTPADAQRVAETLNNLLIGVK